MNSKHTRKGITALLAAVMIVSVLVVVSPVQATSGALYAGGSDPGYVYEYTGETSWDIISPDLGYAVLDLVEYDGQLYAGIMSSSGVGQVYRYDGGTTWTLVGTMDGQVCSLAVYQDDLYAGTARNDMRLYRYDDPGWTLVVDYGEWSGTRALHVSHGYLLMGDIGFDNFGRWDGTDFYADLYGGGSCIWDYEDYGDNVYASAYCGRMWQSSNAMTWSVLLDYYLPDTYPDMWELETFQGSLYMSYDNGELRASSVPDRGTLVYTAPDAIISMTTDGDNLYFGTGGEAGYWGWTEGIAGVYMYDGTDVELISGVDEMVTGVQVLSIAAIVTSVNRPPVADAGPDQTVEQAYYQGADVTLDGSGSSDPDGDPLTYSWTWDGESATGVSPTVSLPLGATTVTLVVNDGTVNSDPATVVITVRDTTPPVISVTVSPDTLWPPNHKMVDIVATVTVDDICDATPTVVLTSVTSDEPDDAKGNGDGKTVNDIQGNDTETEDYEFQLRAERCGTEDGRIYTITYRVTDASGNTADASATVVVPHDMG